MFSFLLHEVAHLGGMLLFGVPPERVTVSLLGCSLILSSKNSLTYPQSIAVSLLGPGANLFLAGALWLFGRGDTSLFSINLLIGCLHLCPVEPLDGGLAVKGLLKWKIGEKRAETVSFFLSLTFLLPLAVLGFSVLLYSGTNFSLLAISVYLMLYLIFGEKDLSL